VKMRGVMGEEVGMGRVSEMGSETCAWHEKRTTDARGAIEIFILQIGCVSQPSLEKMLLCVCAG
jgi:hypothetical protein